MSEPRPLARLLTVALIAGLIAGVVATALQAALVWPLIAQAEVFEDAAEHAKPHDHTGSPQAGAQHADDAQHAEASPAMRIGLSVLTNAAVWVGYALILTAAMFLARRKLDWRIGLIWGAAAYIAIVLAPALGLQPVPPGVETGALPGRQLWWIATALCTCVGLGLMLLSRGRSRWALAGAGLILLLLPHVIGAPVGPPTGSAPPELRRQFAWMVLLTTLPPWLIGGALLGGLLGHLPGTRRISS